MPDLIARHETRVGQGVIGEGPSPDFNSKALPCASKHALPWPLAAASSFTAGPCRSGEGITGRGVLCQ